MKNATLKLTVLVALVAFMAISASASTIVLTGTGSSTTINLGGSSVNPGYTATIKFELTASNQMKITVTNTGAAGSKLFSMGFSSSPDIAGVTGTSSNVTNWNVCGNGNCGLGSLVEIAFGSNGGNNGLGAGESGSITFNFTNGLPINITDVYAHIGGLQPTSDKITENNVPEPASLVLLGTGLLSAGGFVRRKFAR